MKKREKIFKDFPQLKSIKKLLLDAIDGKIKHPINEAYKRYTLRKPKRYDEAIKILENCKDIHERMWAYFYIDSYFWGTALFNHLNKAFSKINNLPGFGKLCKNLRNSDQFYDTISEIEFAAYFSRRYPLELEPKISYEKHTKRLDTKIKFERRHVLFEILTPRMYEKLRESTKAIEIPNRSKNKILSKIKDQLDPVSPSINSPVVIVVNCSHSEITETTLENAILGQESYVMIIDKKTGKIIDTDSKREKNSLIETHSSSTIVTAIIVYRRNIRPWGIEFKKKIILNKRATRPLTAKEYKAISRFDLRKI